MNTNKPTRLAVIEALPDEMQGYALVDWPTTTALLGYKDKESAREALIKAGVPLIEVGPRKRMPMWRDLRALLERLRANRIAAA